MLYHIWTIGGGTLLVVVATPMLFSFAADTLITAVLRAFVRMPCRLVFHLICCSLPRLVVAAVVCSSTPARPATAAAATAVLGLYSQAHEAPEP